MPLRGARRLVWQPVGLVWLVWGQWWAWWGPSAMVPVGWHSPSAAGRWDGGSLWAVRSMRDHGRPAVVEARHPANVRANAMGARDGASCACL